MTTWINLLPPEIQQKRKAKKLVIYFLFGYAVLILFLIFIYGALSYRLYGQEKLISERKQENVKLTTEIAELKAYEAKQAELHRFEDAANRALAGKVLWSRILNELSMVIPGDVWLNDFSGDTVAGISLKGYTFDHPAVAKWMVRQKEIKKFTNIGLQYSKKTELDKQNVIEFSTTAQLIGIPGATAPRAQIPARSAKR